jgi:Mlc titration factor MtfA (ptsG expression regulator)
MYIDYRYSNNAEFLAVVSECFFDNPKKFQKRHPELYQFFSTIFNPEKTSQNLKLNTLANTR